MPQFLMSFGNTNDFIVDWTRIRKWAGSDPVSTVGSEEHHTTVWTGLISNDWNDPGNWTAGVLVQAVLSLSPAEPTPLYSTEPWQ
jgi:hypothetical protein